MPALRDHACRARILARPTLATSLVLPVIGRRAADSGWWIAAGTLLLLQAVLIVGHQPWHDEWHSVLIAIQSRGWAGLRENLRYEAHAPLWYGLLDLTRIVVPARWMLVAVQLPIGLALQALILFGSPFRRWQRLCIAASFYVLIDYGTIARSLSLGVLAATIGVASRNRRVGSLALAVMPAIDMIFGMLSLPLILSRLRDNSLWWPSLALWLASAMSTAWLLQPAPDMVPALTHDSWWIDAIDYLANLSVLMVPLHMADGSLMWNHRLPLFFALVLGPVFVSFAMRQVAGRTIDRTLLAGFLVLTGLLYVAVYPLPIRYLSLIAWLLILLQWRFVARGGSVDRGFQVWIVIAAACGLLTAAVNLVQPFNNAEATTAYIRDHHLADETWTVFPEYKNESVTALSGIAFVRLGANCTQTFMRWDRRPVIEDVPTLRRALQRLVALRGSSYLMSSLRLGSIFPPSFLQPIAVIPPGYDGQASYLFRIAPDRPATRTPLPSCDARTVPLLPAKALAGTTVGS